MLPARLAELKTAKEGKYYYWDEFDPNNPLTAPFAKWRRGANPDFAKEELKPFVNRYWRVDPVKDAGVVVGSYADGDRSPALVERSVGRGPRRAVHHHARPTADPPKPGLE